MGKSTKGALLDEGRFLTKAEMANLLHVSATSVYMLSIRKHNPLPSVKVGKSRRYPNDKARAWMAGLKS